MLSYEIIQHAVILKSSKFRKIFKSIKKSFDEEYTKALNVAKISLNFFSKVNNDVLTIQCLEIPVCNRLLVSERS